MRAVYGRWFGTKLLEHYFDVSRGTRPKKHRLKRRFSEQYRHGLCLYGHFNRARGLGVHDYYPGLDQFVTILRDPFERATSGYFFMRKQASVFKDKTTIPQSGLEDYLRETRVSSLNIFPFEVTEANYREVLEERFLHVGIAEDLQESACALASTLGLPSPQVGRLNGVQHTEGVSREVRDDFIARHELEYAVYEHAKRHYKSNR